MGLKMALLKQWGGVATLVVASIILIAGVWAPGLWEPWEMDQSQVSRLMAEPPLVLVAEPGNGEIKGKLEAGLADRAKIEALSGGYDAIRTATSDRIFEAVVIDIDGSISSNDDVEGVKALASFLTSSAVKNRSTKFIIYSGGKLDLQAIYSAIKAQWAQQETTDEPHVAKMNGLAASLTEFATPDDLVPSVKSALAGHSCIAQFKEGGYTVFLAPLHPWLVSKSFKIFGFNEFGARFPSALMGILTLIVIFFGVRRAFDEKTAILSVIILASSSLFLIGSRFVQPGASIQFALVLAATAFGVAVTGAFRVWPLVVLGLATILLYFAGGMTGLVIIVSLVLAYPLVVGKLSRQTLIAAAVVVGLLLVGTILTFVPDAAYFLQFRFTKALFSDGMQPVYHNYAFAIKQIGFGLFPWSAFLPLVLAYAVSFKEPKPTKVLVLIGVLAPLGMLMISIFAFDQTFYYGTPFLAVLIALYLRDREDDALESRLLALFGFGLFLLLARNLLKSPDPIISFLTTDPMFVAPGKGDPAFPENVSLPSLAKLALVVIAGLLFATSTKAFSLLTKLPAFLARGRNFLIVMLVMVGVILIDILVFVALKWGLLVNGPYRGKVLLSILLTGPDIVLLYLVCLLLIAARYAESIGKYVKSDLPRRFWDALLKLEKASVSTVGIAIAAIVFGLTVAFQLVPELSLHLSQKHIIEAYKVSNAKSPGELFRHQLGQSKSNVYVTDIPEVTARNQVISRLKDKSKRSFFILPKNQFSEVNHAIRAAGGSLAVLDDSSSRLVLVSNSLAAGEVDYNWLTDATLTEEEFAKIPGMQTTSVVFDDKIELVGVKLGAPTAKRGKETEIKLYFKALDKIPTSYRMFMHVDRVGSSSRIHGDHWVLNLVRETEDQNQCVGCYATTHWLKGDIVVDTYNIKVPIGALSGLYNVWIGFYQPSGGKRLTVTSFDKEKVRHDGNNRVSVSPVTVE